jgi:hypothetical protein
VRFRTGAAAGFAAGYYFGARAGRARYEQIRRVLDAIPFGVMFEKMQALARLGFERIRAKRAANPYDSKR